MLELDARAHKNIMDSLVPQHQGKTNPDAPKITDKNTQEHPLSYPKYGIRY